MARHGFRRLDPRVDGEGSCGGEAVIHIGGRLYRHADRRPCHHVDTFLGTECCFLEWGRAERCGADRGDAPAMQCDSVGFADKATAVAIETTANLKLK